jgi:hypothetical protein
MCQSVSCEGLKCTCWVFEALEYRHRVKKFTGGGVGGGGGMAPTAGFFYRWVPRGLPR